MAIRKKNYSESSRSSLYEAYVQFSLAVDGEDLKIPSEYKRVSPSRCILDEGYKPVSKLEKLLEKLNLGHNNSDNVFTIEKDGYQALVFEHAGQYFLSNWFYDMQEKKLEAVTYPALRSLGVEEILSIAIWASTGADGMLSQTDTKNMAGVMEKVSRTPVDIPEYDEMDVRSSVRAMVLDSILDSDILTAAGREVLEKRAYDQKAMESFKAEAAKILAPKNDENVHKDVSFIVSTKLPDVEIVRSNINHPDVDFVLLFVPEHGSFKSADKLPELKAIRNFAGDSLIEIKVQGVRYFNPEDPIYSDVEISKKGLKSIVEQFREKLPKEYIDGKPFGVAVFAPEDICGYKANLDSSWTQYSIGSEVFDCLKLCGLNISSIVSMFPGELFVDGFSFEAVEHGVPLTVSVGVKDLSTLKDESYGERFCPSCYLNHNTREVDFETSSDFVKVDFLELLSYGKAKSESLKVNRKRKMSGIKF